MKLVPELFIIPHEERYVVYSPFSPKILSVGKAEALFLQLLQNDALPQNFPEGAAFRELLKREQFLVSEEQETLFFRVLQEDQQRGFDTKSTRITLFPTLDCNLACTFCYSSGGDKEKGKTTVLEGHFVRAAIDQVIQNALEKGEQQIGLQFHGGGEPTHGLGWLVMQNAVAYAKERAQKQDLTVYVCLASNGVLDNKKKEWFAKNVDEVQLSFDGPDDMQEQRPYKNGRNSFPEVFATIRFFEETGVNYSLRATVTNRTVNKLERLVDFVADNTSQKKVHIEPVSITGRALTTGEEVIPMEKFMAALSAAEAYGKVRGIDVVCQRISETPQSRFCSAIRGSFTVAPGGYLTACPEVAEPKDAFSNIFLVGKYDGTTGQFVYDAERIEYLGNRSVLNLEACTDCFAKYNCAGDCSVRLARETGGDVYATDKNPRCELTRELFKRQLLDRLEGASLDLETR